MRRMFSLRRSGGSLSVIASSVLLWPCDYSLPSEALSIEQGQPLREADQSPALNVLDHAGCRTLRRGAIGGQQPVRVYVHDMREHRRIPLQAFARSLQTGRIELVRHEHIVELATHVGIGIVRTRPCFPTRSTMHHRPSRCWTWPTVSAATSDRLSPQPRSTARIARSRKPWVVAASGVFSRVWACRMESQLPRRTPLEATPFTRVIPLASSGASSPL